MTARRITKESQLSLLQKFTLFLLVLAGMNFMGQYKILSVLACVVFLIATVKFSIGRDFFWLMLLSVSWVVFSPEGTATIVSAIMPFVFPLAYCVGMNFLPLDNQEKAEKNFRTAIIVASTGPFVHFLLNFINNLGKSVERNTNDFWTGEVMAATGQATLALMILSVSIVMLFTSARARSKVLCVLILILVFIYNLTLAGRTLFVMLMLIFAVSILFLVIKGEKKSKKYKTLLIIVMIILVLIALYNMNIFGIQDTIESSNLYDRFFGDAAKELDEDSRMEKKQGYLEDFRKSLWGGLHLRPIHGYAHDIILDTYDEAGIFALIAIIAFLISSIARLFSVIKNKALSFETKQWVLGLYVAILIQFMVEPVIQGIPWMLMLFCFIHGMTTRLDTATRKRIVASGQDKE